LQEEVSALRATVASQAAIMATLTNSVAMPPSPPVPPRPPPPPNPPQAPMVLSGLECWFDAVATIDQFGDSTPTSLPDQSGNGNDFVPRAGLSLTVFMDEAGGSYLINGGGFTVPMWSSFKSAAEITLEAWANLVGYKSGNTGILTNFLGGGGKFNWMWTNAQRMHNNGFKGNIYTSGPNYNTGTWYRFALRYSTTVGYELFVNNVLEATQSATGSLAIAATASGNIGLGVREDGYEPSNAYWGAARIYTRALSNDELQLNFDSEKLRYGYAASDNGNVATWT